MNTYEVTTRSGDNSWHIYSINAHYMMVNEHRVLQLFTKDAGKETLVAAFAEWVSCSQLAETDAVV